MTKEEMLQECKSRGSHNKCWDGSVTRLMIFSYNLALDHAAEKANKMLESGNTDFLIPNEILNLKITE